MSKYKRKRTIRSDTIFKYFMKESEYQYWFLDIIKEKIGLDLSNYHLSDNEANTGSILKDYRMDIVFENQNKNQKVIIEMNNQRGYAENKGYQYLYRVEGSSINEGEEYKEKHTKLIMFNHFRNKLIPELKIANLKLQDKKSAYRRNDSNSSD